MIEAKIGLSSILKNYKIVLNEQTKVPLELDKDSQLTQVRGGIWVNVEKL